MKRHTSQTLQQARGQYNTVKAKELLQDYTKYVSFKRVIDPCAGEGDLLAWATANGAISTEGYDIDSTKYPIRDTILNPLDYSNYLVISNPPYLTRNKAKKQYTAVYDKYKLNDLYKCHLASLIEGQCKEGIEIVPTNFLSESNSKMRALFFQHYTIPYATYWTEPCFENATTGICIFYFRRKEAGEPIHSTIRLLPKDETIQVTLRPEYGYLWGDEFFDYIGSDSLDIQKITVSTPKSLYSHLVLGLLDKGKWQQGLSYNDDDPIISSTTAFTTYQLAFDIVLSESQQRQIVLRFNERLQYFRDKYRGLFLTNYMGANQKILPVSYCYRLLTKIINDEILPSTKHAFLSTWGNI